MKVTTDACLFGAWVAESIQSSKQNERLLDIGTGTGLLSLMILQKHPHLNIDAVDIELNAVRQAEENVRSSPWPQSVHTFHCDISRFEPTKKYNLIISNPPFYEKELKSPDPSRTLAHHGGLTLNALMESTKTLLEENGRFYFLLPYKRIRETTGYLDKNGLKAREIVHVRQSPTHKDFRVMISGSHTSHQTPTAEREILIMDETNEYSPAFRSLLKDYYLHL